MKQIITSFYDGSSLHLHSFNEECEFRDLIYGNVSRFINQRRRWLLSIHSDKMKYIKAFERLKQFVDVYKNYSACAVAKKVLGMEADLYLIMPSPQGKQASWCFQIETILKMCREFINHADNEHIYKPIQQ
jgi:hypothetical protein